MLFRLLRMPIPASQPSPLTAATCTTHARWSSQQAQTIVSWACQARRNTQAKVSPTAPPAMVSSSATSRLWWSAAATALSKKLISCPVSARPSPLFIGVPRSVLPASWWSVRNAIRKSISCLTLWCRRFAATRTAYRRWRCATPPPKRPLQSPLTAFSWRLGTLLPLLFLTGL